MKKIIALFLSLLMLLSVCLTGCAEKTDEEAVEDISKKASKSAMTLSLYLLAENEVEKCADCVAHDAGEAGKKVCTDQKDAQPCTYRLISDAVNRITESKYKTRLILNYCADETEYYARLEKAFADREAARKAGTLGNTTIAEETEEDETFVNELGQIEIKYPTIAGYQVDIFFLGGTEKFNQYKKQGVLASLDSELADASKLLKQYIFPEFLDSVKTLGGGSTYALPNNRAVGQYTYMLLNKDALDAAYRRTEGATTYETYVSLVAQDTEAFLDYIYNNQAAKFYPINKGGMTTAEIAKTNMRFIGLDENGKMSNEYSILGAPYLKDQSYGTALNAGSLLSDGTNGSHDYLSVLETLKNYEAKGYYDVVPGKNFAVGYIKGGAEIYDQYSKDYEIIVVENPTLTAEDVLANTFAVGANTMSLTRSMQILTLLNTDEEFRNLILYGIEGEHYRLVPSGEKNALGDEYQLAERLNNKYSMKAERTGNVFISYPTVDQNPAIYDLGIKQNQDLRVDMLLGFDLNTTGYKVDTEAWEVLRVVSEGIWMMYEEAETYDEFYDGLVKLHDETLWEDEEDKEVVRLYLWAADTLFYVHPEDEVCEGSSCTAFYCAYISWLSSAGLLK